MKNSATLVGLIISNTLILTICFLIYNGFKDSEASFGTLAGIFNVIILFPIMHAIAAVVFMGLKLTIARNTHFILSGLAVLGILIFIFWSKGS